MSIAVVEREVLRFLRSVGGGVLCITGKWGVGKTYAWDGYLAKARAENIPIAKRCSYVSLFGLNSLDQFRLALVVGSLTSNPVGATEFFAERSRQFLRNLGNSLQKIPKLGEYSALIVSATFSLLQGELFCIDDLERKGKDLSIKDILGLVTQLAVEKKCKVVIILNDGDLQEKDREEFETYHEKVIDVSLTYAPTPQESTQIALSESAIDQAIAKYSIELGLSNIRIIKKIQTKVKQIAEIITTSDARILKPIIQSIVLLAWCIYSPTEAPSVDFLKARRLRVSSRKGEAEFAPEETKWNSILLEYDFTHFDEFDATLLRGIKDGFFNEAEVKKFAADADVKIKAQDRIAVLKAAWAKLHGSFADNEAEVVKAFEEGVAAAGPFMSIHDLFTVVSVLKQLGEQERATILIANYMQMHSDKERDFFDIDNHPFGSDMKDEELRDALYRKLASFEDNRFPRDVLITMSKSRGWNPQDISLLAALTEEDFYKLFKETPEDDLNRVILPAMQFAQSGASVLWSEVFPRRRVRR